MTTKLIAVYSAPEDRQAFLTHYHATHTPLVARIPGLVDTRVTMIEQTLMGEGAPFMIAEMIFADQAAFDVAMASPENRAAGKDLMTFAKGRVILVKGRDEP